MTPNPFNHQNLPIPLDPSQSIIDGSKLKSFMACPRQFFYEYLLGWRSEYPNNHLIFGSAVHEALEVLLVEGYEREQRRRAFEKFITYYREHLTEDTDELFEPKTPERFKRFLPEYCARYKGDLERFEVLHVEVRGETNIGGFPVHLRMDSILSDQEKREKGRAHVCSLEHKTGQRNDAKWADQWSLAVSTFIYYHFLVEQFGVEEVDAIIYNGLFFKRVKWESSSGMFDFARVEKRKNAEQMKAGLEMLHHYLIDLQRNYTILSSCSDEEDALIAFPMNPTACSHYTGCSYRDLCLTWSNPLRHCEKPPLGFKVEFWNPLD